MSRKQILTNLLLILLVSHNFGYALHYFANNNQPGLDFDVPKILQPQFDIDAGNGLTDVYYWIYDTDLFSFSHIVELALVFADEDRPHYDHEYDAFRMLYYRRITDIETIFLYVTDDGEIGRVNMRSIYAGLNDWTDSSHQDGEYEIQNHEPVIYVNTWNHALSLIKNPALSYVEPTYNLYHENMENVYCDYDWACLIG